MAFSPLSRTASAAAAVDVRTRLTGLDLQRSTTPRHKKGPAEAGLSITSSILLALRIIGRLARLPEGLLWLDCPDGMF